MGRLSSSRWQRQAYTSHKNKRVRPLSCKFAVPSFKEGTYEIEKITEYTCDEVRTLAKSWKKTYYIDNAVAWAEKVFKKKDERYRDYCMEIDSFLDDCKCKPLQDKCDKGSPEDHEGPKHMFCRCEDRNMRLARKLRSEGKSPWKEKSVE